MALILVGVKRVDSFWYQMPRTTPSNNVARKKMSNTAMFSNQNDAFCDEEAVVEADKKSSDVANP